MKNTKCSKCGLVDWSDAPVCKRCNFPVSSRYTSKLNNENAAESSQYSNLSTSETLTKVLEPDINYNGWKKIKVGGIVTAIYIAILTTIILNGYSLKSINPFALVVTLAPTAWMLAGILEVITGIPFIELSQKWDSLDGWQRGVIGISVFGIGILLLIVVCFLILFALDFS